mgnify:CR=1 FL=1
MIAIPWYFIEIKEEASLFGLIYAGITLASLGWSLYSGTLIDKYSRKKMFVSVTSIGFLVIGSVALYGFASGEVPMWLIAVVFGFTMFNYQIHYPTLYAFGQEITSAKDYSKINSYLEIQGQAANIAAGALGALLLSGVNPDTLALFGIEEMPFEITPLEMHDIFLIDASTYLVAAIIISFISYKPIVDRQIDIGSIKERIRQGVEFLKENLLLFHFGNASYSVFVFVLLCVHLLIPMYVDNHLQETAGLFSLSYMLYATGALSAGVWIRKMFHEKSFIKGIIIMMSICMLGTFAIAFTKSIYLFVLYSLMLGVTNAAVRIMRVTYLFNHVPNGIIGRVSSVFHVINILLRFAFIGLFSLAYFDQDNNIIYAFLIFGVFLFLSIIPLYKYRQKLESPSSISR